MRISVYNQITHIHALTIDLGRAKFIVVIQSPYLAEKNIERWTDDIKALIARGVIVCVFVNLPEHYYGCHPKPYKETANATLRKCVKMLEDLGVHVNLVENVHTKLVIIDYRWVWDGSLNFLSSNPESDISERANRFDDVIHTMAAFSRYNLERCAKCEERSNAISEGVFLLNTNSLVQPSATPTLGAAAIATPNAPTPSASAPTPSAAAIAAKKTPKVLKYPPAEWRSKGKLSYGLDRDFVALAKNEKFLPSLVGSWLHSKRTELGFRTSDLIADLGLTKKSITSIETGRFAPSLASLVKFVERLGWQVIIVPRDIVPLLDYIVRSYHRSSVAAMVPKSKPYRLPPKNLGNVTQQKGTKRRLSQGSELQTSFEPPLNLPSEAARKSPEGEVNPSQQTPSDQPKGS